MDSILTPDGLDRTVSLVSVLIETEYPAFRFASTFRTLLYSLRWLTECIGSFPSTAELFSTAVERLGVKRALVGVKKSKLQKKAADMVIKAPLIFLKPIRITLLHSLALTYIILT